MLIYQLVGIKYLLDTNTYVHVCVHVHVWVTGLLLCTCSDPTIWLPSVFPSARVDGWFSHIKLALILIIYWPRSHLRLGLAGSVVLAFQSMCWLLLLCFFCLYNLLWRHMALILYSLQAAVEFPLSQTISCLSKNDNINGSEASVVWLCYL